MTAKMQDKIFLVKLKKQGKIKPWKVDKGKRNQSKESLAKMSRSVVKMTFPVSKVDEIIVALIFYFFWYYLS